MVAGNFHPSAAVYWGRCSTGIRSLAHSLTRSLAHSLTRSLAHPLTRSLAHSGFLFKVGVDGFNRAAELQDRLDGYTSDDSNRR
jgi:hypothetical protein